MQCGYGHSHCYLKSIIKPSKNLLLWLSKSLWQIRNSHYGKPNLFSSVVENSHQLLHGGTAVKDFASSLIFSQQQTPERIFCSVPGMYAYALETCHPKNLWQYTLELVGVCQLHTVATCRDSRFSVDLALLNIIFGHGGCQSTVFVLQALTEPLTIDKELANGI